MFKKTKLNRIAIAVAMSVGMSTAAMAQETSSSMEGSITTPTGAPAAGTQITVIHVPSGSTKTATVNNSGSFSVSGLRVGGPYRVIVDSNEFQDTTVDEVFLSLGETFNVGLQLEQASNIEVISVTASQLSSAALGQIGPSATFDLADLQKAPSINRNITDVIRMDPRVYVDETRGDANPVQCVGKSNRFNSLTVDGVKMNDSFGLGSSGYPTVRMPFSYDAIDQVSVEIAPFDVVYTGFTGCNINAVTKSGTNEVHGGVFFDYGSDSFQGDSLEGDSINSPENSDKRYGFNVGFPILQDKVFAFVSYEKYEGNSIFTRGTLGSGAINEVELRQEDLDEIIRISNELYQYDPGPVPTSLPEEDEKLLVKLDWNINDEHRLSYTYTFNDGNFMNTSDGDSNEFELLNHIYEVGSELKSHQLSLYSDWSDNFSTEVRLSKLDVDNRQISIENASGTVGGSNFGEVQVDVVNPDSGDEVTVYLGGDDSRQANDLNYSVDGLILRGKYLFDNDHTLTFGYEREALEVFNVFVQHTETELRFSSIADFEAGTPNAIYYNNAPSGDPNDAAAEWDYAIHSVYAQDEFYPTDDLKLKVGLRYDWYTTDSRPLENPDFTADYGFSNGTNLDGEGLLQPRIGFNYTLDDNTDLRGGIGIFSGGNPNVWFSNNFSNNNVLQFGQRGRNFGYTDGSRSLFDDDVVYSGLEDGVPAGPGYGIPSELYDAVAAGDGANNEINYFDPNFKIPSETKLSLGATHVTADDYVLQADLLVSVTKDQAIVLRGDLEQTGTNDEGYPIYDSVRLPSFVLTNSSEDSTSYTISFGLMKSWDNGINLTTGYAYNHAEDVQPMTSSVAFSNYQYRAFTDPQEQVSSLSDYNIEHRFTAALTYDVEFLDGYDTTFSVFGLIQSGRPYSRTVPRGEVNGIYGFNPYLDSNNVLPMGNERNGENGSWWNKLDVRVSQQLPGFMADHSSNVFFVIDNFTNLLNDDWGIAERVSFNTVDFDDTTPENRQGDASLWQMRIGFNYNF
ncbi:TonB-dependent receptor [Aliiglaciecola lipolytica]|uniref:Oar-like outer membrane protein n=1 Tax=Aliiglaciecola lipolytica E3 TaxID=1127673 RepID=K6YB67_9ALTE|nr:TonB-dependent receptor [Aliiglaciecola lipolytica]GAC15427.1 oar-like outer membrane protein [Aliiglaciecola lipolytica E3]